MKQLLRYRPFEGLSRSDLTLVARQTQAITLPGARWLVRPGRHPDGHYFLLKGQLELLDTEGGRSRLSERDDRARHAVHPGTHGVSTVSTAQILRVDVRSVAFLLGDSEHASYGITTLAPDAWLTRFLGGGIMQGLSHGQWQKVLRAFRPMTVRAGEPVVTEGDPGNAFFVVQSGSAEVRVAGRRVAMLHPGAYFGEDALITAGRRRASVIMLSDGVLGVMPAETFADLLVATVVRTVEGNAGLRLAVDAGLRADLTVPLEQLREAAGDLDAGQPYVVLAGDATRAALGAFILTHHGFTARVAPG